MALVNSPVPGSTNRGVVLVACASVVCALALMLVSPGSPVQASSTKGREAGAVLFHEKGCEHCHGVNGVGTDRAPALTIVGKLLKKEQIKQQIEMGGNGMPAYGELLQPDEVKWLVEFLHDKRKAPKKPPVTAAPSVSPAPPPAAQPGL